MDTVMHVIENQDKHKKEYMRRFWRGEIRGALAYNVAEPLEEIKLEAKADSNIAELFLENRLKDLGRRNWEGKHKIVLTSPSSFFSGGGGIMATAFGAKYNQEYDHTAPAIDSADQIESLNLNPTIEDGLIPEALQIIRYFVEKTEGKIPLQMYNAGGPMDIASMVLNDTELMTAVYTHPKDVRIFTSSFIRLSRLLFRIGRRQSQMICIYPMETRYCAEKTGSVKYRKRLLWNSKSRTSIKYQKHLEELRYIVADVWIISSRCSKKR